MKAHELSRHILQKGLGALYAVIGEEAFFRDQALTLIQQASQSQNSQERGKTIPRESDSTPFFSDVIYGDETDSSEILTLSEEVPFFSSRRVVLVKWADKLPAKQGEALIPYLQEPNSATTLVFAASKLDGRTKWVQELKKRAMVVECVPLFDNQRATWVTQAARKLGLDLEPSAMELLKDLAAEGLYAPLRELEKLAAYLPENQRVTAQDVENVRGKPPGISVFDWSEAVAQGDQGRALDIVAKNLETGEAPLRMLGAFLWQMRKIWKTRALIAEGKEPGQAARQAGIPPFRARDFLMQVQSWSEPKLRRAWDAFAQADSGLKGGRAGNPKLLLDELVLHLCQSDHTSTGNKPARH